MPGAGVPLIVPRSHEVGSFAKREARQSYSGSVISPIHDALVNTAWEYHRESSADARIRSPEMNSR